MLGLVTVLYKSDEVLEDFFRSISIQKFSDYKLYLVDNSYNDISTQLIDNYLSKFLISNCIHINAGGNIGVAAGNNIGIKEALADKCTDVILLNNDIEFEQTDVFEKILLVSIEKNVPIVVPKILYYDTQKVWMAGGYMDNIRALGVHYTADNSKDERINKPKYITYAPTCFMLVKADVFSKIGLMDEKYFAYCDDTDFVYRAVKLKLEIYYEPSITILHKVSSSSGGDNSLFYIYYSNRNKIYFIRKNYKHIHKYFAIAVALFSRIFYYIRFNIEQRNKLKNAFLDGFKL